MAGKPGLFRRLGRFLEGFRRFVLNALTLLVIIAVVAAIFFEQSEEVPGGAALILALRGNVVDEYTLLSPIEQLREGEVQREVLLSDARTAILRAAKDSRIAMLVLSFNELDHIGMSKSSELIPALQAFRETGKPVIAVADYYDQDDYYLAAHADEIYTHPLGGVVIEGLAVYRNYFRDALDKLSVQVDVFRVGEFKSALEPYMRNDMSEDARAAAQSMIDQLWSQYRSTIITERKLEPEQFDFYVNRIDELMAMSGGDTAKVAADARLVDGILNHTQWVELLKSRVGSNSDGEVNGIGFRKYLRATQTNKEDEAPKVAVVVVAGTIMPGDSGPGTAGSDTIVERVAEAIEDKDVKAVVLRVDSPGGSVFASEQIRNQLEELRAAGKPWVVSMGSVAASGGYWIAAEADEIWATPATLTGSIGVFGARPSLAETMGKLGVYTDGVATGPLAGAMRIDRPLSDVARRSIQSGVEFSYDKFLSIVADGREMTVAEADALARGRVWTGAESKQLKLVDHLGGLKDAAQAAAMRAGLATYDVVWIEDDLPPGLQLFQNLFDEFGVVLPAPVLAVLRTLAIPVNALAQLADKRGIYAWCTVCAAP